MIYFADFYEEANRFIRKVLEISFKKSGKTQHFSQKIFLNVQSANLWKLSLYPFFVVVVGRKCGGKCSSIPKSVKDYDASTASTIFLPFGQEESAGEIWVKDEGKIERAWPNIYTEGGGSAD